MYKRKNGYKWYASITYHSGVFCVRACVRACMRVCVCEDREKEREGESEK